MTDHPIIFSAPMVRALLDGRKTQTRRVLKVQPGNGAKGCYHRPDGRWIWVSAPRPDNGIGYDGVGLTNPFALPYAPGDRLWVREAFVKGFDLDENDRPIGDPRVWYRATDAGLRWLDGDADTVLENAPWRPSIHMPRWASRLTLTVTDVRVQRLQEISRADAISEGVTRCAWAEDMAGDDRTEWHVPEFNAGEYPGLTNSHPTPIGPFSELWNSLHGSGAWDANPWVVALTFTVRRGNIDEVSHG